MKTISSFLLGILLFLFGTGTAFTAPACDRTGNPNACHSEYRRMHSKYPTDRMQQRSLRRQHTREAYDRHDTGKTHNSDLDAPRFHKGKKMTPDERNRLRQQIDEAGQAIYHQ